MIIREKEEKKNINELRISKRLKNKNIIDIYGATQFLKMQIAL